MALDHHERLALHQGLVDGLGSETADRLMAALPAVDWSEVATKQDLRDLEQRIDRRFDVIDHRFQLMEQRFDTIEPMIEGKLGTHLRSLYFGLAALMLAVAALTVASLGAFAYFVD